MNDPGPITVTDSSGSVVASERLVAGRNGRDTPVYQVRSWSVTAPEEFAYEVQLADGLLDPENPALLDAAGGSGGPARRFVVIDDRVADHYGDRVRDYLTRNQVQHRILRLRVSEETKTMQAVLRLVSALDDFGISRRREPIIAIGGGVLLDIAGLAASLYRRGTPHVRVPTTLVGLIDAGIGVKTGVNHGVHKNRLGTYFAPAAVLLDRSFLATLDRRHLSNGLAEILKIALVTDARLFDLLEAHGQLLIDERFQGTTETGRRAADEVLDRAIAGMLHELAPNLKEQQLDRLVDFGHSISPSIEMVALPELLHGEAVAIDMALFTMLAARRGSVGSEESGRVLRLMRALDLPVDHPAVDWPLLVEAMESTIRHRDGLQRLPLPAGIGAAAFANDVTLGELARALEDLREMERAHA
uniref:2-epi-5-epi-valiolone synthase n=1 Tax=Actinoplanes sp. A40644 TaxID=236489 RepID=Q767G5_9ACTN|nr:putative 2-epi-5-epi-valiolone synthase [Actinoplanes sp. A40644]